MTIFPWVLATILLAYSAALTHAYYRLGIKVIILEDSVEECLDSLDVQYSSISKVLETEVASDDPFIKDVLQRIRESRSSVLEVANKLTSFASQEGRDE